MKTSLREEFEIELTKGYDCLSQGRVQHAFRHAEIAHVLGQRHVRPHVRSHWLLLRIGLRRRSATEVWGQMLRIVLGALGSAAGIVPTGNTGGTNVGMFRRMPVGPRMAKLLNGEPPETPGKVMKD